MSTMVTPHQKSQAAIVQRHVSSFPLCCINVEFNRGHILSLTFTVVLISTNPSTCFSPPSIMHSFIPNALYSRPASPPPFLQLPLIPLACPSCPYLSPSSLSCELFLLLQSSLTASLSLIPFSDGPGKICWLSESGMHPINPGLLSGQRWAQPHQFHPL